MAKYKPHLHGNTYLFEIPTHPQTLSTEFCKQSGKSTENAFLPLQTSSVSIIFPVSKRGCKECTGSWGWVCAGCAPPPYDVHRTQQASTSKLTRSGSEATVLQSTKLLSSNIRWEPAARLGSSALTRPLRWYRRAGSSGTAGASGSGSLAAVRGVNAAVTLVTGKAKPNHPRSGIHWNRIALSGGWLRGFPWLRFKTLSCCSGTFCSGLKARTLLTSIWMCQQWVLQQTRIDRQYFHSGWHLSGFSLCMLSGFYLRCQGKSNLENKPQILQSSRTLNYSWKPIWKLLSGSLMLHQVYL